MKKIILILTVAIIAAVPFLSATEKQAKNNALAIALIAASKGYDVRDTYHSGFLVEDRSKIVRTTLHRGNSYRLVAGGCNDARDVDILLYDENWNLIAKDTTTDKLSEVAITPRWTGVFYIKIKMYDAKSGGAHWVLMYAYN